MRLISADELTELYDGCDGLSVPIAVVRQNIEDALTVDAEPVRHGHWGDAALLKSNFMFRNGLHATQRQCTSCHRYSAQLYDYPMVVPEMYQYRFCPHCGAKMMDEVSE